MKTWPSFSTAGVHDSTFIAIVLFQSARVPELAVGFRRLDLDVLEAARRLSLSPGPAAPSLTLVWRQQPFAILSSHNDSFPLPPSVSIPLFHCLFTSLHQSVPHHSFSSLVLATGNNSLSSFCLSLPLPLFSLSLSFREHRILGALSGTTATRE